MLRAGISSFVCVAALAACAEPAIDMSLQLPSMERAAGYNLSCIGAVQVFIRGNDRGGGSEDSPGRPADDSYDCVEVEGIDSFAKLRQTIAGRFSLAIPGSGILGVDVRASTGTCKKDNAPGDTITYGLAQYRGGEQLVIPLVPNLSCNATRMESVRPVDLLALTRGGVCPGPISDAVMGGVESATIHPTAFAESFIDYNNDFASVIGGVASLPLYLTTDEDSCIAINYWDKDEAYTTDSCVRRSQGVCSAAGQIEVPIVTYDVAYQAVNAQYVDDYGGFVIGGVWGTDAVGTKVRLTGATVRPAKPADAERTKIVYAEYPAGAPAPKEIAGAAATNATGLFIVYVGQPRDFIVSASGYRDETVRMGSPDEPSTALILMTKR